MGEELKVVRGIQAVLDPLCLVGEPSPGVSGRSAPVLHVLLVEGGWSVFLVKVSNEAGSPLPSSPNARSMHNSPKEELRDRWLDLSTFDKQPLTPTLVVGTRIPPLSLQPGSWETGGKAPV